MKKITLFLSLMLAGAGFAQEAAETKTSPLEISGSGDLYYKYDFSGNQNIPTSFANEQNSLSLGMLDIAVKKTTGKASFVGEISFGPRGTYQSIPNIAGTGKLVQLNRLKIDSSAVETSGESFNIQNLYATYAFTDKFSMTAGYMGTFVGYEVISPVPNFHYSTSYLFTNGPFQNAGVKANYKITDNFGAMVGLFNDTWNVYQADPQFGLSTVGGQLSFTNDKVSAYLNILDGYKSGTIIDLTATFQLTDKFKLGLNSADFSIDDDKGFTGLALYPSYAVTDAFSLGLRGEYFKLKEKSGDSSVTALTLSGNLKAGGFTFIPEVRFDNGSEEFFKDADGLATKAATQAVLAVVYAF